MSAHILIVEDEKAIALALSGLLRKQGYEITAVHDAPRAIAKARAGASIWCSPIWRSDVEAAVWMCCQPAERLTPTCRY